MNRSLVGSATLAFFGANTIAILAAVWSGFAHGNLAFRFEEKQAITFISATQLGATALLGWLVFLVRDRAEPRQRGQRFWIISAAGFLYLFLDESFQFHEGMDTAVAGAIGWNGNPLLDGVATAVYGVVAAALCYRYRTEILRYGPTVRLFLLGGVFLAITSALNIGEATETKIVLEESAKLFGVVSFLLGHLAAFVGALAELGSEVTPVRSPLPGPPSAARPDGADETEAPGRADERRPGTPCPSPRAGRHR